MKKALIVWGGWDGHEPEKVAMLCEAVLSRNGFEVIIGTTLDAYRDEKIMSGLDLIVPVWTMGKITPEQLTPVLTAVEAGTGIAGCHGGMCDAFRESTEWQFMTGGQWVAHPGNDGTPYKVRVIPDSHPILDGIKDFHVVSEQYYLHVDPAVRVHAVTDFPVAPGPHTSNGTVAMPVIWTKYWGKGRVFYFSLGHHCDVLMQEPASVILERGLLWAARPENGDRS